MSLQSACQEEGLPHNGLEKVTISCVGEPYRRASDEGGH
jgi:hypothetical protein